MRVAGPNPNMAYTRSSTPTSRGQSGRIKPRVHFDPARVWPIPPPVPPRESASCTLHLPPPPPAVPWRRMQGCLRYAPSSNDDTGYFGTIRLRQNSLASMPLLANSATNCRISLRGRRFITAICCSGCTPPVQHRRRFANRWDGQTFTVDQLKSKVSPEAKLVNCFGCPPAKGCSQRLLTPLRDMRYCKAVPLADQPGLEIPPGTPYSRTGGPPCVGITASLQAKGFADW